MASEKVYVCGRCSDYGAPNLEDLVTHMSNCGVPDVRKKDETSSYEEENNEIAFDESENSQSAIEYVDISLEKDSPPQKKRFLDCTPTSRQLEYEDFEEYILGYSLLSNAASDMDKSILLIVHVGRIDQSPFLWGKKTGLMLLNLVKSHKEDMESPYIRRKTVWQKIAMEMRDKYGYCVTGSQCENKFKNMTNRYRRARDHNMKPDCKEKMSCFLYDELDEYFRSDASYQPRRDTLFVSKIKPKVIPSKYIDSDTDCADAESMNISNSESMNFSSNRQPMNYTSNREPMNISSNREPVNVFNREPMNIAKGESSINNSAGSETEPIWVKRMMETFERCHRENMKMQREFIDVLKKILDKQ